MKKRIPFYFLHFFLLALLIFIAVCVYFINFHLGLDVFWTLTRNFLNDRLTNLLFILGAFFSLNFLFGLVSYESREMEFAVVQYLTLLFKVVLILGMVSFVEFYLFYETKIGRLIYLNLFIFFSIYYYFYLKTRSSGQFREIIWLAQEPAAGVLDRYTKTWDRYKVYGFESIDSLLESKADIIYARDQIHDEVKELLIKSKLKGKRVWELADFVENEAEKIPIDFVDVPWLLEKFNHMDRNYLRLTRAFDILIAATLMLILFPIGFLLSIVHRIFSRGTLFYIQERLGLYGRPFKLIKFRTMIQHAEESGARFAERDDPRITRIGRLMRRLRIDEIPQLINVIKGEMKLVGPRPERAIFIETLSSKIPYYSLRLQVRPGLTGWAQVQGQYAGENVNDHKEKLEYDLYYIKNKSFFFDLLILAKTIKIMFHARGA